MMFITIVSFPYDSNHLKRIQIIPMARVATTQQVSLDHSPFLSWWSPFLIFKSKRKQNHNLCYYNKFYPFSTLSSFCICIW